METKPKFLSGSCAEKNSYTTTTTKSAPWLRRFDVWVRFEFFLIVQAATSSKSSTSNPLDSVVIFFFSLPYIKANQSHVELEALALASYPLPFIKHKKCKVGYVWALSCLLRWGVLASGHAWKLQEKANSRRWSIYREVPVTQFSGRPQTTGGGLQQVHELACIRRWAQLSFSTS